MLGTVALAAEYNGIGKASHVRDKLAEIIRVSELGYAAQVAGVDMVTVVTEGIFSYCGVKVKIDTDRHLGPERSLVRKGLEAYLTALLEFAWPKQRIMEVYLNLAETGIGTYGVNAGSQRYFDHDASAMSRPWCFGCSARSPSSVFRPNMSPSTYSG